MSGQPSGRKFVPHETLPWFAWFGEYTVFAALIIVWGPVAWATYQFLRGQFVIAALLLAVWVPLFIVVARFLHRRGLVRLSVSIVTTVLFVAVLVVVVGVGR